jgi:hypothetical protein
MKTVLQDRQIEILAKRGHVVIATKLDLDKHKIVSLAILYREKEISYIFLTSKF